MRRTTGCAKVCETIGKSAILTQVLHHRIYMYLQDNVRFLMFFRCASISCTDHRNSLTHGPKLEIGLFSCLTALSPSVLYSIHGNDTSGQSSHPDRTGPDQTRPGSKPDQSLKLQKVFVSNYKIYLSQTAKCICLKLQNVFVSNCKMYLCQIAKCICLKFQNVFVSNCKMYISPTQCSSNIYQQNRCQVALKINCAQF